MGYSWLAISIYFVLARFIVPILFGKEYNSIVDKSIYMVLAVVPQSIILLQSRLFIASNKERIDMLMNLLALIVNVALLMILLSSSYKSLEAVYLSIFIALSLVVFVQDYLMIKYRLAVGYLTIINYGLSFLPVIVFIVLIVNNVSKPIIVTTAIAIAVFFLLLKKFLLYKLQLKF